MPRNMLVGRLTMHRDGFGFVIPDPTSLDANLKARLAGDVFIAPHATGSSMHGDRVLVEVGTIRPDGRARTSPARYSLTVTLIILIGVRGRSFCPVCAVSIFLTTSIPDVILPNTGCLDCPAENQSR